MLAMANAAGIAPWISELRRVTEPLLHLAVWWDMTLAVIGLIFLLTAGRGYRAIVMANCAALGWYVGLYLVHWSWLAAAAAALAGTILGLILIPAMQITLIIVGALIGCATGMTLWRWFHQPPDLRWAPAAAGLVLLGVAGLYFFRAGVIVLCTLQGAVLLVAGGLGVLLRLGPVGWRRSIRIHWLENPGALLAVIVIVACVSLLVQFQQRWRSERRAPEQDPARREE
ncbi:MAG: hypothetical protein M1588_04845 [Planctomycetes bacterium]|jgi:hypothetical protein|nr:hypothetical protein [Planctomycetota bacterium]